MLERTSLDDLFGNFLFGPVDFKHYGEQIKKLQISGALTAFNSALTSIQFALGLFILSRNFYWRFIIVKGQLQKISASFWIPLFLIFLGKHIESSIII